MSCDDSGIRAPLVNPAPEDGILPSSSEGFVGIRTRFDVPPLLPARWRLPRFGGIVLSKGTCGLIHPFRKILLQAGSLHVYSASYFSASALPSWDSSGSPPLINSARRRFSSGYSAASFRSPLSPWAEHLHGVHLSESLSRFHRQICPQAHGHISRSRHRRTPTSVPAVPLHCRATPTFRPWAM